MWSCEIQFVELLKTVFFNSAAWSQNPLRDLREIAAGREGFQESMKRSTAASEPLAAAVVLHFLLSTVFTHSDSFVCGSLD